MAKGTTTFTAAGTFTAPSTLLNGKVVVTALGGGPSGSGAHVVAALALAAGGQLAISFIAGGAGGSASHAGGAGGAAAVVRSSAGVLLVVAGGGGGAGGSNANKSGGRGGNAAKTGVAGVGGGTMETPGGGGTQTAGGAGGAGNLSGTAGGSLSGGSGGSGTGVTSVGGGGGGAGHYGGGGGGGSSGAYGGGGGGGGSSFASTTATTVTYTTGNSGAASVTITYTYATAPSAPTLDTPANGSSAAPGNRLLKSTYHSTDGYSANAYALELKTTTAGSYSYWNASTAALQSTIVWNTCSVATGATFGVTLPSTLFAGGKSYQWSMAYQESGANLQGPFATPFVFSVLGPPTLTVTAPSGTVAEARPVVKWTATPSGSASITYYQVVVYDTAQHPAGWSPGTPPTDWDSGKVAGNPGSVAIGAPLANHTTYTTYVKVWETGTLTSGWVKTKFTVAFDAPAAPTVTATPTTTATTGYPVIELSVQGHTNLLSAVDASFETGIGTWTATPGADFSLTRSSAWAVDGSYSLGVECTTAAAPLIAPQSYACEPNTVYTFIASVRAASALRTWEMEATWEKSTGAVIATVTVATGSDSTTGVRLKGAATSPATAAKVLVKLTTTAAWAGTIPAPGAPTVTPEGTPGTTTYDYEITAENVYGETVASAVGATTTGNATLSTTNYNALSWAAVPLPAGSLGNLVYDSNLTNAIAAVGPTWQQNGSTVGIANGDFTALNPGTDSAEWQYLGTGAAQSFIGPSSAAIAVTPGATYELSAVMDVPTGTTHITDLGVLLGPPATPRSFYTYVPAGMVGTQTLSEAWVCPAGVTEVSLMCYQNGAVVPAGSAVTWSRIQLTETSTVQTYEPGPLFTYPVFRKVGTIYKQIGTTTALGFHDTGQAATTVSPPTVNTTGETHDADAVGIFPGTVTAWSAGGFVGNTVLRVTRSDGLYLRGASTLNPATMPTSQLITLYDYECVPTVEYHYTGVVVTATTALNSLGGVSNTATVSVTGWWETDPTKPTRAVHAQVTQWNPVQTEASAAHMVMGQTTMNVVANTVLNQDFSATFWIGTATVYAKFVALVQSQRIVFIASPFGPLDSGYFKIAPQTGGLSAGVGNKTRTAQLLASTATQPVRTVQVTAVAQPRPVP